MAAPRHASSSIVNNLIRGQTGIWEIWIGLEIHAQILSNTKLFSPGACVSTRSSVDVLPNSRAHAIDLALPGTLPRLNERCVAQALRTATAFHCDIHKVSRFERKHYFYCDLPQGYQITQQRAPVASGGYIELSNAQRVRITRIQLEQDSGKSMHDQAENATLVDLNRAGTGLMEIVLEPDLRSIEDTGELVRHVQHMLRHLKTCDGLMEEGSIRCDLNVNVQRIETFDNADDKPLLKSKRVEVKNMNSIRNMMKAAEYEAKRQVSVMEAGGTIDRETRTFDAILNRTRRLRTKDGAKDYRFFPEPDVPPLVLSRAYIEAIQRSMPELPKAISERLQDVYGLSTYECQVLLHDSLAVEFFEHIIGHHAKLPVKLVINWMLNDLFSLLKTTNVAIHDSPVSADRLGALLQLIENGTISGKMAKELLPIMYYEDQRSPEKILAEKGWLQISDADHIQRLCQDLIADPVSEL